jgi:hypothetical protein
MRMYQIWDVILLSLTDGEYTQAHGDSILYGYRQSSEMDAHFRWTCSIYTEMTKASTGTRDSDPVANLGVGLLERTVDCQALCRDCQSGVY